MKLRAIQPLVLPSAPGAVNLGKRPEMKWVAPQSLFVDGTYQRDMSRRSVALLQRMIKSFAWNKMKPPICVRVGDKLHVVDGQHTAIAAATLNIPEIPVFIVGADAIDERARAFVAHNTDRVSVTPIDIYQALLAAGDPDAVDVDRTCKRAGVRLRIMSIDSVVNVGDCASVARIRQLVSSRGPMKARAVLECLVKAKRAPITGSELKAADILINDQNIDAQKLSHAIRIDGNDGFNKANAKAVTDRVPIWRCLAERWQRRIGFKVAA